MIRLRGLDLFAGGGGCSMGFARAGFDMTGVDLIPHEEYPFPLVVGDAVSVARAPHILDGFDFVAASPPCPRWSRITPKHRRDEHPDLLTPIREALQAWGGPYVIENVPGAPLIDPVTLCGSMFGLRVRRHRLFESNVMLLAPQCQHRGHENVGVYGDHWDRPGGWLRPDGTSRGVKATSVADAQDAMGIDWLTTWDDLTDAIPPAYTQHIGEQLLAHITEAAA